MDFTKKLDSSPEYLKLLLENSSQGIIACDMNFTITFRNKKALELHGVPPGENSQKWPEYLTIMDSEGVYPLPYEQLPIVRALKGETVVDYYCVLKRKNLPNILIKYNASPLQDETGKMIGVICSSEDCTDLAHSVARFKAIFDQSPLSIQIVGKNGKTLLVNKAFQELWSISDDFVQNFILKDYNILQDPILKKSGQLDSIHRAFQGEASNTLPLFYDPASVGLQGRSRWATATMYPLIDSLGEVREVVIIHQDVTDQQVDREEKERVLAKLEAIVKQMPAGVIVVNNRGDISVYNERMKTMIGEPNRAKEIFMIQLQKSIMGEVVKGTEVRTKTLDGVPQVLSVSSGPVFDGDGKIKSTVVIASDITREKRNLANQGLLDQLKSFLLSTIDYKQIVEKIAAATIPYFADGCMIDLVEGDSVKFIVGKHRYPHIENIIYKMRAEYPPQPGSPAPSMRVINTGKAEIMTKVDSDILKVNTVDERHFQYLVDIGNISNICVPIEVRGETIGALNFMVTTDRPLFDETDLEVAKNIAYYAAFAIENGKLYQDAKSGLQLRDDFISIASHELKTPITSLNLQIEVLNSLVDSLQGESEVPRLMRKFLGSTNNQLKRLSRLVDDMLDISRISTGKLTLHIKKVNIRHLCLEVLERFSDVLKEENIEAKLIAEKDITVPCDADRIDQVITNFMTNAIRYGGKKTHSHYPS